MKIEQTAETMIRSYERPSLTSRVNSVRCADVFSLSMFHLTLKLGDGFGIGMVAVIGWDWVGKVMKVAGMGWGQGQC